MVIDTTLNQLFWTWALNGSCRFTHAPLRIENFRSCFFFGRQCCLTIKIFQRHLFNVKLVSIKVWNFKHVCTIRSLSLKSVIILHFLTIFDLELFFDLYYSLYINYQDKLLEKCSHEISIWIFGKKKDIISIWNLWYDEMIPVELKQNSKS